MCVVFADVQGLYVQPSRGGKLNEELKIDTIEKAELKATGPAAIEEIMADISKKDKTPAVRKVLAFMDRPDATPDGLMTAVRRLIFLKGTDAHDYKFSSAALEDYYHASPAWRARFLASSVCWLKGSGDADNDLVKRTRAALT